MNTSISICLKSDFKVFEKISDNKFKLCWGKEDLGDDYCSYASGVYTGPIESLTPNVLEREIANSGRDMSCNEYIEFFKYINITNINKVNVLRRTLLKTISKYGESNNVDGFFINNIHIWLDKAIRVGLSLRFQAEKAKGLTDTTLWYNTLQFPLKVDDAINMLYDIELYASACYDNTQKHLAAIQTLQTIEEIKAYDYTTGYPEKLRF